MVSCRKCQAIIQQAIGRKGGRITENEMKEHLEMLHSYLSSMDGL